MSEVRVSCQLDALRLAVMSAKDLLRQSLYMAFGSIDLGTNCFLIYIVAKCKELHFNAYILAAALAATDTVSGVAFIAAGAQRLHVILSNETSMLIAPWQCIYVPSASLFLIGYHGGPIMIILISLDRLLAVTAGKFYFSLGKRYTMLLISICILYVCIILCYFTYDMMYLTPQEPTVTKFCWGIYTETAHAYDYYSPTIYVSIGVLIMALALLVLRYRMPTTQQGRTGGQNNAQAISAARNDKAAKLLALISFNTFCMWSIPELMVIIVDSYGATMFAEYAPFFWLLQPIHGVTNLVIYFRKGSPFRKAYAKLRGQQVQVTIIRSGSTVRQ